MAHRCVRLWATCTGVLPSPMPPHCRKKRRAQKSRQVTALYSQALNEHRFSLSFLHFNEVHLHLTAPSFVFCGGESLSPTLTAAPTDPHRAPPAFHLHTGGHLCKQALCVCVWGGIPEQPGVLLKGLSQLGYAGHSGVRSGVWDDPRPSGGQEEGSGVLRFAVLDSMCMVSYISQAKEM